MLSWSQVELLPGTLGALGRIARGPFRVVIVTNQSAVGRGLLTLSDLQTIHDALLAQVRTAGGQIDLSRSYLVGDAVTDVQAALAAGCQPIMVRTGRGKSQLHRLSSAGCGHVPVVADLAAAVDWIQAQVPW